MSKRPSKAKDAMKDEYDFAQAQRGKFYRENAELIPPVHLEPEVLKYLQDRAQARGTSLSQLVNQLLKKDIELIETAR
jgi:predicted HicB family RNase H-like nuclease